jgi:hypothetical protein
MFSAFADATLCDYGGLYAQKPQKWAFTVEDQFGFRLFWLRVDF